MKKKLYLIIFIILLILSGIFILNIEVTTRQGIDNEVSTLKIPLYLKILDFYDRHYNYKWLVHNIIKGKVNDEEKKVMAIFDWTVENIRHQPIELRTIDDHVWHIIIRGYGEHDQFSDVFTTLSNYAGIEAFFARLYNKEHTSQIPFSFAKINNRWCIFDPYNSIYFIKKDGSLASVEDIAKGDWVIKGIGENSIRSKVGYKDYFNEILAIDFKKSHKWSRANIQSPMNRFFYGVFKRYFIRDND